MDLEGYVQQISRLGWNKEGYTSIAVRLQLILERLYDEANEEAYDRLKRDYYDD